MNYPPLPNFKKLFGIFGKVKVSQLEEMKNNLEDFTMTAVTSFPIPPTELLKFVEYPFTVSAIYGHGYSVPYIKIFWDFQNLMLKVLSFFFFLPLFFFLFINSCPAKTSFSWL